MAVEHGERWFAPPDRSLQVEPVGPAVLAFHQGLPGYVPTPLVEVPSLATELGVGRVFVKDESSRLGLPAFKALGATWAVHRALAGRAGTGTIALVCATDGNHGRAVARTARLLGHAAVVHLAPGVHPTASAAIAAEGATVVEGAGSYDDAVARASARVDADPDHAILVQDMGWPGYEEIPAWIVEGYATMCAEADAQLAALGVGRPDLVAIPVGVGSLAQAVVAHCRSATAATAGVTGTGGRLPALVSVEPVTAACLLESLRADRLVTVETGASIMTGLVCGTPSGLAWPLLRDGLDAAVAVDDEACRAAMRDLAGTGLAVGPCGAAALAGVRALADDPASRERVGLAEDAVVVLLATEGAEANPQG